MASASIPSRWAGVRVPQNASRLSGLGSFREIQDLAPIQVRSHLKVAVPLRDGLVDPAGDAASHRPRPDPPRLVPGDAEEVGPALDGALAQEVDGEPLEQRRELALAQPRGRGAASPCLSSNHFRLQNHALLVFRQTDRLKRRKSWALMATITVLRDMRSAPTAGDRTTPTGARTPAARGKATMLYPAAHQRFWIILR